jgi:hypothetical protein
MYSQTPMQRPFWVNKGKQFQFTTTPALIPVLVVDKVWLSNRVFTLHSVSDC